MADRRIEVLLHPLDQAIPVDVDHNVVPAGLHPGEGRGQEIREQRPFQIGCTHSP